MSTARLSLYTDSTPLNFEGSFSLPQYKDFLQLMIDASTEEGEPVAAEGSKKLSDEEIVSHSVGFLLAGYETTANTLAFASYLLALNPEVQERLGAEIDEYHQNNTVGYLCLLLSILITSVRSS